MVAPLPHCTLAWHITTRCNLQCKHCLRRTPRDERRRELSLDDCFAVLRSFAEFVEQSGRTADVTFDGKNPLSRPDFLEVLEDAHALKRRGVIQRLAISGNPESLTPEAVGVLRKAEVSVYNLSLDGLEQTNDELRGPGNYRALWEAYERLTEAGIRAPLKMTLFKRNAGELIDLLRLLIERGIDSLGVGLMILVGGGEKLRHEELSPSEYRALLSEVLGFLDTEARETELRRNFLRQMPMYGRLFHELGRMDEYRQLGRHSMGSLEAGGRLLFVVWPDGEVVPRRELAPVGYVPRQSFREIYESSWILHRFEDERTMRAERDRARRNFVTCSACPAADTCGVGAVVSNSRVIHYPSQHCWVCAG